MFLPIESIVEGTWRSGPGPREFFIFTLCDQLKTTPKRLFEEMSPYELRFFWDCYQIRWEHEHSEVEKSRSRR